VATFLTHPLFTRTLLESFIPDPAAATEECLAIYRRPLSVAGSTQAIGEWLPALLLQPMESPRSGQPASYRSLRVPVNVLWGELDTITPLAQGRRITELVPGSRLHALPGVGHIPQIEDVERFNRTLLEVVRAL
jgi:pimeloyl-ACP methyl ester carboxylesterase